METVETYLEQGDALRAEGKWEEALQCYQQVIELEPENWLAHHHLGDAYLCFKKYEEAITYYRRCLKLNADFTWSYYNLGVALLKLEKPEEAFNLHQKLTEINPDFWKLNKVDFKIQHQIGDFYFEQKDWDKAIMAYYRAIDLNSESHWSYCNLGRVFYQLNKHEEAIRFINQAVQLESSFAWGYYYLGDILADLGRWDEAVEACQTAVEKDNNFPEFKEKLYEIIHQRGTSNLKISLDHYSDRYIKEKDSLEVPQKNKVEFYLDLAKNLEIKGNINSAIDIYNKILGQDQNNTDIYIKKGDLLAEAGCIDEASECYYKATINQ